MALSMHIRSDSLPKYLEYVCTLCLYAGKQRLHREEIVLFIVLTGAYMTAAFLISIENSRSVVIFGLDIRDMHCSEHYTLIL